VVQHNRDHQPSTIAQHVWLAFIAQMGAKRFVRAVRAQILDRALRLIVNHAHLFALEEILQFARLMVITIGLVTKSTTLLVKLNSITVLKDVCLRMRLYDALRMSLLRWQRFVS
jgi:hypothetical protein